MEWRGPPLPVPVPIDTSWDGRELYGGGIRWKEGVEEGDLIRLNEDKRVCLEEAAYS